MALTCKLNATQASASRSQRAVCPRSRVAVQAVRASAQSHAEASSALPLGRRELLGLAAGIAMSSALPVLPVKADGGEWQSLYHEVKMSRTESRRARGWRRGRQRGLGTWQGPGMPHKPTRPGKVRVCVLTSGAMQSQKQ
mgnify:CR=1 FL=1